MNSPLCNYDPETVVFCHSNWGEDGKGMGRKAHEIFGCDACSDCHRYLDVSTVPVSEKRDLFHRAMKKTQLRRVEQGLLAIKGAA